MLTPPFSLILKKSGSFVEHELNELSRDYCPGGDGTGISVESGLFRESKLDSGACSIGRNAGECMTPVFLAATCVEILYTY